MFIRSLSENDIALDLAATGKRSALSKVASRIAPQAGLGGQKILAALLHRERLGSTSVGHGVAIPHARLDIGAAPVASLTRLAQPIDFGTPEDEPVDLLFTLLWPASEPATFLPALARASRLFRSPTVRDGLRHAQSAGEALALLTAEPQKTVRVDRPPLPFSTARLSYGA